MRHEIVLAPEAIEDLRGLPAREARAIRAAIEIHLRYEPTMTSRSRIKQLRELVHPQFRLRVGDYRVFFDVRSGVVEILGVISKRHTAAWLARPGLME